MPDNELSGYSQASEVKAKIESFKTINNYHSGAYDEDDAFKVSNAACGYRYS
jgi:hypothetical protein